MKERCDGCQFWNEFDTAQEDETAHDDANIGICERFPPVWVGNHHGENLRTFSPMKWEQPVTRTHDCCGEWKSGKKSPD